MRARSTSALARSSLVAFLLLAGVVFLLVRMQTVADAMQASGLLGMWASDCEHAASRVRYARTEGGGAVMQRHFRGASSSDTYPVTSVTMAADGIVTMTLDLSSGGGTRIISLIRSGNRLRMISDQVAGTGDYRVRDGRFTDGGDETPWEHRCEG